MIARLKSARKPAASAYQAYFHSRPTLNSPRSFRAAKVRLIDTLVEVYTEAKEHAGASEAGSPVSREAADHSATYVVAATLMEGTVTPRLFNDAHRGRPELRALMNKIKVVENEEFTKAFARLPREHRTRVTVETINGKLLTGKSGGDQDDLSAPRSDAQIVENSVAGNCILTDPQGGFMLMPRILAWIFSIGIVVSGVDAASAQNYPNKPIRLITSVLGGSPDFVSRLIAQGISGGLGQNVIVDNRGSIMSGELVSQALPDGYTLLLSAGSLWVGSLLQKTPYDPVRDFAPISLVTTQPNVLVVSPSVPVKSVKELIALAKSRPGELNYASSTTGAANHLAAELFKSMAGVKIQRIPYKGIGLATTDLISGRVQMAFPGAGGVMPHVKSGKLRALAVTGSRRSELLPGLPTVAESGVPGYESVVVNAVFAPAKTPATIINRLNHEIVRFLRTPQGKEKFLDAGSEVVGSSPGELGATRISDMARMSKVIRDAGIRAEE